MWQSEAFCARSVAGYLFLSEADPLPGCFADLQIEGSLDCLLLIWKGRAAFCDLCRLMHLPLETSSCTTIELLSKLQLAFFFFPFFKNSHLSSICSISSRGNGLRFNIFVNPLD